MRYIGICIAIKQGCVSLMNRPVRKTAFGEFFKIRLFSFMQRCAFATEWNDSAEGAEAEISQKKEQFDSIIVWVIEKGDFHKKTEMQYNGEFPRTAKKPCGKGIISYHKAIIFLQLISCILALICIRSNRTGSERIARIQRIRTFGRL